MPEIRHSVCALDCPDTCGLLINVDAGVGSKLRGDPDHPVTRGFLCGKVARYLEREYHTNRLMHPMRRLGAKGEGRFERISWDEAIQTIAERLSEIQRQHGGEAILPYSYAGTMGLLNGSGMDRRFFHRLGASRLDRTICSAAGAAGLKDSVGARFGMDPEHFRHAKLIIAWGANILGTNVHLWPFIVEARRNGAKFYVIDPVINRTGKAADKVFQVNPGSDLALALGLIHVLIRDGLCDQEYISATTTGFDILANRVASYTPERTAQLTGLPADEIVLLAHEYARLSPAAIRLNYGVQRSQRGAAAVQAIALLPALTGGYQKIGGGVSLSTSEAFQFDRKALERPDLQPNGPTRIINMVELDRALNQVSDPPVKAIVVYNSNPASVAPNQNEVVRGLKREDLFTVVLEQFQTDTADYADIVLPVTTFLEHTDLYLAYGHYYLQLAYPALPAPGETKANVEIFRMLAKAHDFTDACFDDSEEDMVAQTIGSGHPFLDGITLERLKKERSVRLNLPEPFLPFSDGFSTPGGKADLGSPNLGYTPPIESRLGDPDLKRKHPLECISSKNDDSMNSTFGHRSDVDLQTAKVYLNHSDASIRGIQTGDAVRIFNDRGVYLGTADVDGVVKPGVVRVPSVRWNKLSANRMGVNSLTSSRLTDAGGGATFYSCLVEVEKCGD